jgi:hypothetical protein
LFDLVSGGCHARAEKKHRGGCKDFLEHVEFSPFGFKVSKIQVQALLPLKHKTHVLGESFRGVKK